MFRILLITSLSLLLTASVQAQNADIWSLERCVNHALENNLNVKISELNVESGSALLKQSQRNKLPNLNGNASVSNRNGYSSDPFSNVFARGNSQSANFSLSSNITLFAGYQLKNRILQNGINLQAQELDLEQMQNDIALQVVQAYLRILFQQELVESAQLQLVSTNKRHDRTRKLVEAGTLARASLLNIKSQIATEDLQLLNSQNQLELAHLSLQQLLRLDPAERFGIIKPNLDAPSGLSSGPNASAVFDKALAIQPFIKAGELRITSSEYDIELAKGGRLPSLSLGVSAFTGYSSLGARAGDPFIGKSEGDVLIDGEAKTLTQFFSSFEREKNPFFNQLDQQLGGNIGLNLSVPIYSRGQNMTNIQQAEIGMKRAQLSSESQKQALQQTIQQAYLDVRSAQSSYAATQDQIEALQTAFDNSEKQFNLGVINSVDFLISKNNLNRANNDLIRAKYDYIFKTKILDFYAGKEIKM